MSHEYREWCCVCLCLTWTYELPFWRYANAHGSIDGQHRRKQDHWKHEEEHRNSPAAAEQIGRCEDPSDRQRGSEIRTPDPEHVKVGDIGTKVEPFAYGLPRGRVIIWQQLRNGKLAALQQHKVRTHLAGNPIPGKDEIENAFSGRYERLSVLAQQGGQGTVFRALASDGTDVALKVYNADQVEERTVREVEALRRLTGPTVIRLHDAGPLDVAGETYRFLATTFVEGESLSDLIARGPSTPELAACIGADIAQALDELWSLRIVHRDVKPANILVQPNGHAVLLDLGVARHLDQKTLTVTGYTFGTIGYFSPEHIGGRTLSCKADVFALGIALQECLLGRHPTRGQQKLLAGGGPSTSTILPNLDHRLVNVIDRMVARQPFDRPTPKAAADEFNRFLRG